MNKTGFVYVDKFTKKYAPNGYAFRYRYRDEDNKIHSITSVDIFTLKQKVEDKKLNWSIIDIDNAINTIREEVRTI